ncbi:MAG: hypothetical protein K6T85_04605, partial [Gorillibacterium sp.]|nr:hypothetical protein [Gorillibacterium sp.]
YDKNITALTKSLERLAFYVTAWLRGRYYRTYPEYVQDEVTRNLRQKDQFSSGRSRNIPHVVTDGNLITARWPQDAKAFAAEIIAGIESHKDECL